MPALNVTFPQFFNARQAVTHAVSVRLNWEDEWATVDNLYCDFAEWVAAPDTSTAGLSFRYGEGMLPGSDSFATVSKLDRLRYFVKIEFTQEDTNFTQKWYGTLEFVADEIQGTTFAGEVIVRGRQSFTAFGLEHLLGQKLVLTSYWEEGNPLLISRVDRALTFNAEGYGNRNNVEVQGSHIFDGSETSRLELQHTWSTGDIAKYLLKYHAGHDRTAAGAEGLKWELETWQGAAFNLPNWDRPTIAAHGRTVRELLDILISRQRLMSWYVKVDNDADATVSVKVAPFVFAGADIPIAPGKILRGNFNDRRIIFEGDASAQAVYTTATVDAVDQVIVTGRRSRSCFTISKADSTIEAGWPTALQTEYNDGAKGSGSYPPLGDVRDRQRRNAEARAADRLAPVYSRYAIPANWDRKAGNGLGTGTKRPVAFKSNAPNTALDLYPPELFILPSLPLLEGHDYSGNNIGNNAVTRHTEGPWRFLPPMVVTPLPEDPTRYAQVESVGSAADLEEIDDDTLRNWSASVSVAPEDRAVLIRVHGQGQHIIAKQEWAPADATDVQIDKFDWHDFLFTVAIESERYCEGRYPEEANLPDQDVIRRTRIDAGPTYTLDYVVEDTVVGIDPEDGSVQRSNGGYANDDRPLLEDLSRLAYEWLKDHKKSLQWETGYFIPFEEAASVKLGDLISEVGDPNQAGDAHKIQNVNSCLTQFRIDVPRTEGGTAPGPAKMTYTTQFAQFDPLAFADTT